MTFAGWTIAWMWITGIAFVAVLLLAAYLRGKGKGFQEGWDSAASLYGRGGGIEE